MMVEQRGSDSSGRPVLSSRECWAAWDAACAMLGFVPTIVQGGHLANAASASAATHQGDAFDIRLWDRTSSQRADMIRVFRAHGFAYWERYPTQGFDLHAHMIPGPWAHPAPQALTQWHAYLNGRDGLARSSADYHPRPNPIVTAPPLEDEMANYADQLNRIEAAQKATDERIKTLAAEERKRDRASWRREAALAREVKRLGGDVDKVLAEVQDEP